MQSRLEHAGPVLNLTAIRALTEWTELVFIQKVCEFLGKRFGDKATSVARIKLLYPSSLESPSDGTEWMLQGNGCDGC